MARVPEFSFDDTRIDERAELCFERLNSSPGKSFPRVFPVAGGELEGFYRFLHNPRVTFDLIEQALALDTAANLSHVQEALAIHDTSEIVPSGKAERIPEFSAAGGGFLAHVSLLASADHSHKSQVFGVGAASVHLKKGRYRTTANLQDRWLDHVIKLEARFGGISLIHLMDREADDCKIWSTLLALGKRFVIRLKYDRFAMAESGDRIRLSECFKSVEPIGQREVVLSKRDASPMPHSRQRFPERTAKLVKLNIAAVRANMVLTDPTHHHPTHEAIPINVVRVWEEKPVNQGKYQTIEWTLLTSEPIATQQDVFRVVDLYRGRWLIEEYFKGLKTGCHIEERQLEDAQSWYRVLVFFLPICTRILNLRVDRLFGQKVPDWVLTPLQWKILEIKAKKKHKQMKSYEDAQLEIAALGGHIKYNGPPGWQTLLHGYLKLLELEEGWLMAQQEM